MSSADLTRLMATEHEAAKTLRDAIQAALALKLRSDERETRLVELFRNALEKVGRVCRTADKRPLFFRESERRLYELDPRPGTEFATLITYWADVTPKRSIVGFALDRIRSRVAETAQIVEVHAIARNSHGCEIVAVNDFGGGMWKRARGGSWQWEANGTNDVLFWTPGSPVAVWKPDFGSESDDALRWLVQQPHFADDALSVHDQRMLFRALLLAPFFPSLGRGRPVHAHLGLSQQRQHDTGKTTAGKLLGRVFVGDKFEPMPPPESSDKGLEAMQLELMHKPFVLLDNVDTDIKWLNDFLCTYATGAEPTKRQLYTDTQQISVPYRGRLVITSRKATFKRPDTASRTIPFRFAPIDGSERKTEFELLGAVSARRDQIWGGILSAIARIQDRLPDLHPPAPSLRLADFERFGWIVSSVYGECDRWERMIPRLRVAQAGFALQDEVLVPVLRHLLEGGDVKDEKTSEFHSRLWSAAKTLEREFDLPLGAGECTEKIKSVQDALEAILDVKIRFRTLHGYTLISIIRNTASPEVSEVTDPTALSSAISGGLS